jgi:integrase
VTFADFTKSWFAEKGATVSPSTLANVRARLDQHVLPRFAAKRMADIRPHDVRSWVAELTSAKHLAPATVKAVFGTFRQIMSTAEVDGVIARNPCVGIKLPRDTNRQPMTVLTPEQLLALSETVDDRFRVLLLTAGYTGLRAGELGALRLEHLDLENRRIYVRESIGEVNGIQVTGPTKSGVPRTVSLPEFLARELEAHIDRYPSTDGYIFTATEGGPIRHRNFMTRHFKPAVRRAGLPTSLRFHDLRHTSASLLIGLGANPKQIQERLGHSTIQLTFDRYGHLFDGHDQQLREGLEGLHATASVSRSCHELDDVGVAAQPERETVPVTRGFLERTTGFEPATPTLARPMAEPVTSTNAGLNGHAGRLAAGCCAAFLIASRRSADLSRTFEPPSRARTRVQPPCPRNRLRTRH